MTEPVPPRPSATVCLLRDGEDGMEVMMGRRSASAKFMAQAWVFPGGRVDEVDEIRAAELVAGDNDAAQLPWILAALRETVEEAAIWLTQPRRVEPLGDRDVYEVLEAAGQTFVADARLFANWVTPADLPIRYDARFFATVLGSGIDPIPDVREIDAAQWVRPSDAILNAARGEWMIPLPTHVTLEQLATANSAADFMESVESADIGRIQPRLSMESDGSLRVVMPWEPGFEELPERNPDPEGLRAALKSSREDGTAPAEFR